MLPSEIVVLRDEAPPVDNVDYGECNREKNARNRVDFADWIDDVAFSQRFLFADLSKRLIGCEAVEHLLDARKFCLVTPIAAYFPGAHFFVFVVVGRVYVQLHLLWYSIINGLRV